MVDRVGNAEGATGGGRIKAVWSNDGPTYPGLTPEEQDRENDPGTNPIDPEAN